MPWKTVNQIPNKYQKTFRKKKYSAKQKRAWLSVLNSALERGKDESYAFASAWSVANELKPKKKPKKPKKKPKKKAKKRLRECWSFKEWVKELENPTE